MSGIEDAQSGKLLYHLTNIENFKSIVIDGLLSRRMISEKDMQFYNVANENIINKRMEYGLGSYIPFHFHPYSAFDVAVKSTYDARNMIYLCIYREFARNEGFKVLPMHPLSMDCCKLYEYDEGFEMIDWKVLTKKNDITEYAKEVKMAECLADRPISIYEIASIFVADLDKRDEVLTILNEAGIPQSNQPMIYVQPKWFENYY